MVRPRGRVTGIIDPAMHRDPYIGDDKQKYSDPQVQQPLGPSLAAQSWRCKGGKQHR